MRTPFRAALLLPAFLLTTAGCGSGVASIAGSVTYQGKPIHSGKVTVVSASGESVSGMITPTGTYGIAATLPPGPVKIAVESPPPQAVPRDADPNDQEIKMLAEQARDYVPIPAKYNSPDQSGLTFTLHSGKNDVPLDLK